MSEEMVKKDEIVEIEGIKVKREQVELIKRTIFIGASDDELRLFFYECARRGTHPMDRLIFPVVRKDKDGNRRVTFQTGIDYLRAAAEETARYIGQKSVVYGEPITQKSEDGDFQAPEWAEVVVLRKDPETGEVNETPFRAFWKEFYPGEKLGFMWRKMPNLMLAKCAEAGALRKGFPRKLGGLYINEEMEQAEAVPFGTTKKQPPLQEPQKKSNGTTAQPPTNENKRIRTQIIGTKEWPSKKPGGNPSFQIKGHLNGNEQSFTSFDRKVFDLAKSEEGSGLFLIIEYIEKAVGDKTYLNIISMDREEGPEDGEDAQ